MDTYAVFKEDKVPLHGSLICFELKSILDKIYGRLSIRQILNNRWKVLVTQNIHSSIFYKFFCAIRDFNIKFDLSTSTRGNKKDKIKKLAVRFTDIRGAIYHLSKGLDNLKDSAKPYINKNVKICTIKLKGSENEQIVMEYAYSKSKLTVSGAYEVMNCYGNVVST